MGIAALSFWGGMLEAEATLEPLKEKMQENLKIIEQAANITMTALDIQEKYVKDMDLRLSNEEKSINNNTINLEFSSQFFGIISTILFSAQKHERIQTKLNYVCGEASKRLSEIINFNELQSTIREMNEKLKPNLMLPKIDTMTKNSGTK